MSDGAPKRSVVGKITSAYGVKGWVKVLSYTEPMDNLLSYRRVIWVAEGGQRELEVEAGKRHGKGMILKLKGFETPETVRVLCGGLIEVAVEEFPALAEGEYYWHQLEGLKVITTAGQLLGVVDHLMETGANDVLVVRATPESIDQQERLIPYLPDQVVQQVDLEAGCLTVDWEPEF